MKKWNDWVSREEFPRLFAPSLEKSYAEYMEGFTDAATGEAKRGFTPPKMAQN